MAAALQDAHRRVAPDGGAPRETTMSEQALQVMDDSCQNAFGRYAEFLRARRLPRLRGEPDVLPTISLLPGNTLLDGKSPRALNDLPTRFEAVAPGCCYWGLYVDSLDHMFVRNDTLIKNDSGELVANPRFVRTLTHEISHVLSSRLGVWDIVGYDRERDEDLAEDFVAFMGMRFPAESSAEDLALHRGRPARSHPPAEPAADHAEGRLPGTAQRLGQYQPTTLGPLLEFAVGRANARPSRRGARGSRGWRYRRSAAASLEIRLELAPC